MKVELSDGAWAVVRDPRKLSERLTGQLEEAQMQIMSLPVMANFSKDEAERLQDMPMVEQIRALGVEGFRAMREMKRTTVLVYVESWSYGAVDRDTLLDEVPGTDVAALFEEISKVVRATGGHHLTREPSPDPESPILPSND